MRCRGVERKTCAGAASRENDTITNSAEDACSVVFGYDVAYEEAWREGAGFELEQNGNTEELCGKKRAHGCAYALGWKRAHVHYLGGEGLVVKPHAGVVARSANSMKFLFRISVKCRPITLSGSSCIPSASA